MASSEGGAGSREPIVRSIQRQLRERIRSGQLAAGTKLPSMRQLSQEFECSLGIVKQAVNTLSAQGYLRSSPRRGVFVASSAPQEREIVVILPHLEIARLHTALIGVRNELADTGHKITVHAGVDDLGEGAPLPEYLLSSAVAGVLVLLPSASAHNTLVPRLVGQGVPTAVVDITTRVSGADVIAIDPLETGRMGARHLTARGHRRLAVVTPVGDTRTPGEVVGGIEQGSAEAGATLVKIEIDRREPRPEPAWTRAREAVAAELGRGGGVTALIGVGPQLTLGACMGVRAAGRSIPGDVSVVGLLGDSSALQAFEPPVTIYDNPLQSVCEKAARRLLGRIQGLDEPPRAFPRLPVLIDRSSVAGPRATSS